MFLTERTIRPSSLSGHRDCPRSTAARMFFTELNGLDYDLKNRATSIGALVGSGTHEDAASILKAKMGTGELGNLEEAKGRSRETFEKRKQKEGCIFDPSTETRSTAQKQIDRMGTVHHGPIAIRIRPVSVEERLKSSVSHGWIVSGQVDSIVRENFALRDLKTGSALFIHGKNYAGEAAVDDNAFDMITHIIHPWWENIYEYIGRLQVTKEA